MRDPLVAPFLATIVGVLAAAWQPFGWPELAVPFFVTLCLWAICLWRKLPWAYSATTAVLFAIAGVGLFQAHQPGPPPVIDFARGEILEIAGCIVEPPALSPDREQIVLELEPGARMRLTIPDKPGLAPPHDLAYGQRIKLQAKLRVPRNFSNPGSFDFQGYLARRGIFWQATAVTPIEREPGSCGTAWRAWLYRIRTSALDRLSSLYATDDFKRGMMKALLLGDTTGIQQVWTENFRRTGTYHALVISGAHITVLAAAFLLLFRILRTPEAWALLITAILAWVYALVAGADPPVTRSAAGFTVVLIARFFFRRVRLLNLLALVGFAFVLYDPGQIFEASFQLSFLCVFALGAFAMPVVEATTGRLARSLGDLDDGERDVSFDPRLASWRVELRLFAETVAVWVRIPRRWISNAMAFALRFGLMAVELALVSAVIQVALALPMIAYFHRLSISGLTANVIATPLLTLAVPVGFLAIFTGWHWPALIAGWMLTWAQRVAEWHARWEPNWRVPDPPVWLALIFGASLAVAAIGLRRRRWYAWPAAAASVAALAVMVVYPFSPTAEPGWLEITAIDVGQGDSVLLVLPDGKLILVDGGGIPLFGRKVAPRMEIGEDVVSPYLWSRGIRRLDAVVLSHAHDDHGGGLPAIITNFHPREIWTGPVPECAVGQKILAAAQGVGAKIRRPAAGEQWDWGKVHFEALAPLTGYESARQPRNSDSLVISVRYGSRTVLLTGDAEGATLRELVDQGRLGKVDILKAAHHGSRTSNTPELLHTLQPALTLISAGFENSYNLPHPAVVQELHSMRVMALRTDESGAVTVRTDGQHFDVDTGRWHAAKGLWSPF